MKNEREILHTFTGEDLQSFVTQGRHGFHVSYKQIESGEFLTSVYIYKTIEKAIEKAKEIV